MTGRLDTVAVPDTLYRVGRGPHVWEWREWPSAESERNFGNRWDDPEGEYRVRYAADTRFGAYLEALARFRPDLTLARDSAAIEENDVDAPKTIPPGHLTTDWRLNHTIGKGVTEGVGEPLAAVGRSKSLAMLRVALKRTAARLGVKDINGEVIRRGDRRLTQAVSRYIYTRTSSTGPLYGGMYYLSAYGDDVHNTALFERSADSVPVMSVERDEVALDDGDFLSACRMHGIRPA